MTGAHSGNTLLATFVHISDIHIGEIDPDTGDAMNSSLATATYRNMPWFDGLLGHQGRSLQDLDDFVSRLKEQESLRLIVTGDLSRFGASAELKDAQAYIETEIELGPNKALGNTFGLRMGTKVLTIPGNHDQWGGAAHPFSPWPSQFGGVFPAPLPRIESVALHNSRSIDFLCIDSDADVKPQTLHRFGAIGSFQSQLHALHLKLTTKRDGEYRILMIHHSWFQKRNILRMSAASKRALEQFLVEHEVSAMLCGHSHHPLLNSFTAKGPLGTSEVYELRSGSTAQLDSVPYRWKTVLKKWPTRHWDPNSLIVHRVYDVQGVVRWHAELHARAPGGFKHVPQWDQDFALL